MIFKKILTLIVHSNFANGILILYAQNNEMNQFM